MNQDLHLKLQAHFDGELSAAEAREVAGLLAKDAEARALVAELQNTRGALAAFEADTKLPESREFYWSKIERGIAQAERREPAGAPVSLLTAWRRFLLPAGAFAALVIAGIVAATNLGRPGGPEAESALADSGAFTYRDYANGTTLVWLSYPAEKELANTDAPDMLD
jgi:anti-sigma factor RsiW